MVLGSGGNLTVAEDSREFVLEQTKRSTVRVFSVPGLCTQDS